MFPLTWLLPPSLRSNLWPPRPLASLCSGIAAFSSTRHAAITKAARSESEEARYQQLLEYQRNRRAKETDEQRQKRLARMRERYTVFRAKETDEQRQERLAATRKYQREIWRKIRPEGIARLRQMRDENLEIRRAVALDYFCRKNKRWAKENWSWPTHQVVRTAARVDHHCTSCDRIRSLKLWWKEKVLRQASNHDATQDRYMCNYCFANRWDLVVPEGNIKRLPLLFTSPDHPPPPRRTDTKTAQQQDRTTMKEEKR